MVKEQPMSATTEYEHYLEQVIVKTLLPVYKKYCETNSVDIYKSGLPQHLLTRAKDKNQVAALLRTKNSGC